MDTTTPDPQSLVERVERLETQYRWLRSEVVTEKLVLVDADGRTRATLRSTEGVPSLILYDANGNTCAILRVSAKGPTLHLLDSKTDAALELRVGEAGPDVSLFDTKGKQRLTLEIEHNGWFPSGTPGLTLCEPNGTAIVTVKAIEDSPSVCLFDPNNPDGNTSANIIVDREGPSLLCVKAGKVLWSAP